MGFERLVAPLRVGPVTLPNRVVFPAHLTNYAVDGLPTERHAAYYGARAAGGAGLVVVEESSTDPADRPYEKLLRGYDPAVVPGYRRVTDAVHAHGALVFAQLNHNGGQSDGRHTRAPVSAPSAVPDPLFREVPREVSTAEIARLVAGYADVAARCVLGGFDGVEVQASQSSLARQFLSRATNRRTDGYGGELAGRARFLVEVLTAVREAIGPGRALGVRLAGDEAVDGGTTLAEAAATAGLLGGRGLVDYVSTTVGVATATLERVIPPMTTPPGYARPVSAAIRAAAGVPVIGVGRFLTPEQAERALADGDCDLVGVARGQIADPEFAAKAFGGRAGEIRTCLGCNQECVGRVGLNRPLGCVTNPRAGREAPLPTPVRRRRVLVVGGGPAGLRAAATAAQRGHAVTLLERAAATGGAVVLAASAPGRHGLRPLVDDLAAECARAGVEVRTGVRATAELVRAEAPDAVVLATGARPARPAWAGPGERVVDVRDVLAGRVAPTGDVLVVDDLGASAAPSVAELLAGRGCTVEVTTAAMVVGQDLGLTLDAPRWRRRATELGIRQSTDRVVEGVEGRVVRLLHHPTGTREERTVDWVVAATPARADDELWRALADSGLEVHRVGDCLAPRRASAATLDGERVGAAL
ncbi:mycofactocin system FadH/OYE family oxidoreductase 2 [Geodermatophilus sabuli]|uniref:2,4-dienoyl-CoA reductase (NADPH2) n=1 Tax=Geodermatophilus sabuli TaxID=1564158 RepID=A0A285EJP7_9ACTN|nr:mycofactocin system FadH/OYE family oxidoreductase 2 [Geodermatophilus sabuli]MBB3086980.1 2,4-dienoyl-CoA reductase (NADPH2) [Geodermatophilus sabuli]SNX99240.1 2,4-dienoyl-CoA reductase (NADPH2) [Geodermatophilus sabuli]